MRPAPRLLTLLVLPCLLAGAAVLATSAPASAAPVTGAITGVTVGPATPAEGSQLTTDITWCVPNGSQAGDTFSLALDPHLRSLPAGFSLDDPTTGVPVATASIAEPVPAAAPSTSPWVTTFTLTAYAQTHTGVCGTAYVTADFDGVTTPARTTTPFVSTTNDGTEFTSPITPTGAGPVDLREATKYGTWLTDDQGQTSTTDVVQWNVDTPNGAFDSAVTTDSATAAGGTPWSFDCDTVVLYDGTVDAAGDFQPNAVGGDVTAPVDYDCSPTAISVRWPAQQAGERFRLRVDASIAAPTGTNSAPATFANDARVVTTTGGVDTPFGASASLVQATAGGDGAGVAVAATPTTPGTPTAPAAPVSPVTSVTPSAVTATPGSIPIVTPARATGRTGELAFTGSDPAPALLLGGGVVALGLVLTLLARRRTTRSDAA